MTQHPPLTTNNVFTNPAARAAGLTDSFWLDAYHRWTDTVNTAPSFAVLEGAQTYRIPYQDGHADVLVRTQPEPREFFTLRMTAFPADENNPPHRIERWHTRAETRPTLGEAVLVDVNARW